MPGAITLLLVYQTIGESIALAFKLPVPGPVIGMLLLFITFFVRGSLSASLRETDDCAAPGSDSWLDALKTAGCLRHA
jgi:hypothetical protein